MYLKELNLVNYKNILQENFVFTHRINCFVGPNGVGKTNILDSIYSLSMTKSYFNPISSQNINHNSDFFMLEGIYENEDKREKVLYSLKKGQKKTIKRNGKVYDKISDHIGLIPSVIISPSDRDLILEGSDVRRKFMDSVISQMDKDFLRASIQYNKALSQRNALLKYFAANRTFDELSLAAYDEQLVTYGLEIYKKRSVFLEAFLPLFTNAYAQLTSQSEPVEVRYKSQLHEGNFQDLLKESLSKDRMAQYSTVGLHKDDLLFDLQGYPIKKYGSQGQQKTFLVALKLAQYELLKMETGIKPILLLDDIFDKLDDSRVERLIQLVSQENYGQIFISDTHDKRTREVVERVRENFEIFNLDYE